MIAITYDVLLAYLIEGESDRSRRAARLIEGEADEGRQVYLSHEVLSRLADALTSTYRRSHEEVDEVIRAILTTTQFHVEDRDAAVDAIVSWSEDKGSYQDWLAFHRAFQAGCHRIFTFDERLGYCWARP